MEQKRGRLEERRGRVARWVGGVEDGDRGGSAGREQRNGRAGGEGTGGRAGASPLGGVGVGVGDDGGVGRPAWMRDWIGSVGPSGLCWHLEERLVNCSFRFGL